MLPSYSKIPGIPIGELVAIRVMLSRAMGCIGAGVLGKIDNRIGAVTSLLGRQAVGNYDARGMTTMQ